MKRGKKQTVKTEDPAQTQAPSSEMETVVDAAEEPIVKEESKLESLLHAMGEGPKPWYLSAQEVYKVVKDSAAAVPLGKEMFDKSLRALIGLTEHINANTHFTIMLTPEQSYELINKLDTVLQDHLELVDDGLDELRGRFVVRLKELTTAVVEHKNWAEGIVREQKQSAEQRVITRFEKASNVLKSLLEVFEQRFPLVYAQSRDALTLTIEQAVRMCNGVVDTRNKVLNAPKAACGIVLSIAGHLLAIAQPHVHYFMEIGAPLWNQTMYISRPLVHPMAKAALARLQIVQTKAEHLAVVGPHISTVGSLALSAAREVKDYCLPPKVEFVSPFN